MHYKATLSFKIMQILCVCYAARSEKFFRGLVWYHHSLKIQFGLRDHTVMLLYFEKSVNMLNKKLYNNILSKSSSNGEFTRTITAIEITIFVNFLSNDNIKVIFAKEIYPCD